MASSKQAGWVLLDIPADDQDFLRIRALAIPDGLLEVGVFDVKTSEQNYHFLPLINIVELLLGNRLNFLLS
ncbi:hypothetical protein HZ99_07270 [Pseudomonas fluorescens]|nr:hypothetical protein HZ99_07270 [Pseudomonas fluorescens]